MLELDKSIRIVKKLKLVGTPFKVFKKTAYIQVSISSKNRITVDLLEEGDAILATREHVDFEIVSVPRECSTVD